MSFPSDSSPNLRGSTQATPEQASERPAAAHILGPQVLGVNRRLVGDPKWPVPQALMRPELVVIEGVRLDDVIQLPEAEAEEQV